jgi:hypothetical protein
VVCLYPAQEWPCTHTALNLVRYAEPSSFRHQGVLITGKPVSSFKKKNPLKKVKIGHFPLSKVL